LIIFGLLLLLFLLIPPFKWVSEWMVRKGDNLSDGGVHVRGECVSEWGSNLEEVTGHSVARRRNVRVSVSVSDDSSLVTMVVAWLSTVLQSI
jgi:hypothetical protein